MRSINVRELKRNLKSIFPIPNEGILVEYRDGQNFFIYPTPKETVIDIPGMGTYTEIEKKAVETVPGYVAHVDIVKTADSFDVKSDPNSPISGWCQLHFEKGKNYPLRKINWEDENGVEVVSKKWACPKCVKHYEDMGRGRVYFI